MKLSSVTTRLRQRNAVDAVYNRWAEAERDGPDGCCVIPIPTSPADPHAG